MFRKQMTLCLPFEDGLCVDVVAVCFIVDVDMFGEHALC